MDVTFINHTVALCWILFLSIFLQFQCQWQRTSLISTHFYLSVYQTHSKLVQKPRWSKVTYSYGASSSTKWGNVSEPLSPMHRVSEETPYIRGKEKCPRRVPATSWHSSSLSWSSARFSGYQKHHKLFCMHSTAIAGRYSCCRHQCWGWSSHPQQLANRHGQDIAYDCR